MDERLVYGMAGMLAALLVGGFVLERLTAPQGTTGSLHEVLPAARARAQAWSARAVLIGLEGRDLVDGRNGDTGAWEFLFADADRPGRMARVVAGRHVLTVREIAARGANAPDAGNGVNFPNAGPFTDDQFGETPVLARRLVAYGMRSHAPATLSIEASGSASPVFKVETTGRLGATWWIDARSGDLLEYRPGEGKIGDP